MNQGSVLFYLNRKTRQKPKEGYTMKKHIRDEKSQTVTFGDRPLYWYASKIYYYMIEGLNNLIQATKARARGYKILKNLKTIVYMFTGKLDYTKVDYPLEMRRNLKLEFSLQTCA